MHNTFKEISIRGRLAFGAMCLEKVLNHLQINNELLTNIVLPNIWSFTNSKDLGYWEESMNEIDPTCSIDSKNGSKSGERIISNEIRQQLIQLYNTLSPSITELISEVIEIGASNIYGGTEEYSPSTLTHLENVIKICRRLNVPLPDVELLKKAPFTEYHGWGNERDREFYLH